MYQYSTYTKNRTQWSETLKTRKSYATQNKILQQKYIQNIDDTRTWNDTDIEKQGTKTKHKKLNKTMNE